MKKFMLFCVVFLLFFSLFAEDDEKLKLAVMDLEDLSGKLSEDTLSGASEYFRVIFAQTNRYIIISKDRQKIRSATSEKNTIPIRATNPALTRTARSSSVRHFRPT